MARGPKRHLKNLFAPKDWMLSKLSGVFAPRPRAGPHKLRESLPLLVLLRNRLKYALNGREAQMILRRKLVNVDSRPRQDTKYPAGFQDVVEIPTTGERYRLFYDVKGRFTLVKIGEAEAKIKLCKVENVYTSMGRTPVVVTHDGRRIRFPALKTRRGDSVLVNHTTGKITDLIKNRFINMREIKIFVLDEADHMLDQQGLKEQTMRVHAMLPRGCQVLLFSATYDDDVTAFALKTVPQPRTTVRLERSQLTVDKIAQFYVECTNDQHKFNVLSDIYAYLTIGQSIIFCQRKATADALCRFMKEAGHTVSLLHGNLDTKERDRVIDEYRFGKTRVLITTNVLSRGIDILQITLVINFDVPVDQSDKPDYATYLHRIGRSGRFGRSGIALNFVSDQKSKRTLKDIEQYFGKPIAEFPSNDLPKLDQMLRELS